MQPKSCFCWQMNQLRICFRFLVSFLSGFVSFIWFCVSCVISVFLCDFVFDLSCFCLYIWCVFDVCQWIICFSFISMHCFYCIYVDSFYSHVLFNNVVYGMTTSDSNGFWMIPSLYGLVTCNVFDIDIRDIACLEYTFIVIIGSNISVWRSDVQNCGHNLNDKEAQQVPTWMASSGVVHDSDDSWLLAVMIIYTRVPYIFWWRWEIQNMFHENYWIGWFGMIWWVLRVIKNNYKFWWVRFIFEWVVNSLYLQVLARA